MSIADDEGRIDHDIHRLYEEIRGLEEENQILTTEVQVLQGEVQTLTTENRDLQKQLTDTLMVLSDLETVLKALIGELQPPNQASQAVLRLQGEEMPGSITVDTTNATATVGFLDDKGDVATPPVSADGGSIVVTFTSDNESVITVATDSTNLLQGDLTPVAEGSANIGATIADDQGNPVLEPDGVTPFSVTAVNVSVGAGAAATADITVNE